MKVTVVVCNYNGEEHLPACLAALRELRGDVAETLLVDNASTDGGLALVARDFPEVRVVETGTNGGPCLARNVGMREARTELVLALDNDAILAPDTLEKLFAAREATGACVVQPRSVFDAEPERVHYDGGALSYLGLIRLRNFYAPLAEAEGEGLVEVDCAISMCLLIDRERMLELGGYDERYFILFEDSDLSYRLRSAGERIVSVEDAVVRHRAGTPGISFRDGPLYPERRVFLHSRNRWVYLAKNHALWTLFVSLPGLALYEAFGFAFALASGHPLAWLRGKFAALGMIARLGADRRRVQAARRVRDGALLVGGPLTLTPAVIASEAKRTLLGGVDALLRAWWALARRVA